MQSPMGEHHYHVREMQRTRVRLWKTQWLVETFFFPIYNSVSFSPLTASSVCSVMVREHMLCSYGLKKTFFSPACGIIDVWSKTSRLSCTTFILILGKEKCLWNQSYRLYEGYYLFLRKYETKYIEVSLFPWHPLTLSNMYRTKWESDKLSTMLGQRSIF